jgi:primosomal protein N' (replication factor Y)
VLCGTVHPGWRCRACGHHTWRSAQTGVIRTAEELGAAFPGTVIRTSSAQQPVRDVPGQPALVLATPGAEPTAAGGYGAVLILDTWVPLGRAGLSAAQEAVRRWLAAASLARPDGVVVLVGDPALAPIQAVVRHDPAGFAQRELAEREQLGLPPAGILAQVDGDPAAVRALHDAVQWPHQANLVATGLDRLLITAGLPARGPVAAALRAGLGALSARKKPLPRVRMDADLDDPASA